MTADDIRILLALLPRLEKEEQEVREILVSKSGRLFSSDCLASSWSHLYELTSKEHITWSLLAFGQEETLKYIAQAPNQMEAMASIIKSIDDDNSEFSPEEVEALRPRLGFVFGIVTSLLRSMHCLMAYGVYINDLIAVARTGGERGDKAIFKAIKIDPTVVGSPTVLARISQATLENDKGFLSSVKKAINGGLSKQAQGNADKIRLVLGVLHESGVERLSNDELHKLFVDELKLYAMSAKADIGDAAKGILAIRDRMRKAKATT